MTNHTPSTPSNASKQAELKTWIQLAIERGAILTVRRSQYQFKAEVSWLLDGVDPIEAEENTIADALSELDARIQDDAANEMIEQGNV